MPASLYVGDCARVARKSMTDFPLPSAFLAKQNPMTWSLIRAADVRRQEAA
jgi:hypothetical protein